MSYTVSLDKAAEKELSKFPKGEQQTMAEAVDELENPLSESLKTRTKAMQGFDNLYRLTVGNRRVIYAVNHKTKQVRVVMFDSRNDMYDKATKERLKGIDKSFKSSSLDTDALDAMALEVFGASKLVVAAAGLRALADDVR